MTMIGIDPSGNRDSSRLAELTRGQRLEAPTPNRVPSLAPDRRGSGWFASVVGLLLLMAAVFTGFVWLCNTLAI